MIIKIPKELKIYIFRKLWNIYFIGSKRKQTIYEYIDRF